MKRFMTFYMCLCIMPNMGYAMQRSQDKITKAEYYVDTACQLIDDFVQQDNMNQSPRIQIAIQVAHAAISKCHDDETKTKLTRKLTQAQQTYDLNKNIPKLTKRNSQDSKGTRNKSCTLF